MKRDYPTEDYEYDPLDHADNTFNMVTAAVLILIGAVIGSLITTAGFLFLNM